MNKTTELNFFQMPRNVGLIRVESEYAINKTTQNIRM